MKGRKENRKDDRMCVLVALQKLPLIQFRTQEKEAREGCRRTWPIWEPCQMLAKRCDGFPFIFFIKIYKKQRQRALRMKHKQALQSSPPSALIYQAF